MPGDVPSKKTPWVLDGGVYKVVQVGNTMIAGGKFTQVADPMNGTQYARQNIVAFDATTGLVSQTFNPTIDGEVQQLMPGPTPDTVYVAGDFTKINGVGPNHIQLLNINTGQAVTSFKAPSTNGGIETMELLPGNRLFIGGFFTKIGGVTRGQLATLNATTGAFDPFMNITVSGHHNTGTGAQAPVGIRESGLAPAGDRMVVVGNFRTVGGLARDQIVMIDLTGANATVATNWYTTGYTPICSPSAFDSYMRDVEMSPDGSFFVVATTGGPHSGTLCDTAARFETYAVGTALTPTWTDTSGGDTLWGVEVTQSAVYIGGHQRWMNNPNGADRAAQGAVPRPGLVALDPQTGIPLKWNPGRNPRGEAAYEIYETDAGLWVVSNTDWIGDRRYQRQRIALLPLQRGLQHGVEEHRRAPGQRLRRRATGGQQRAVPRERRRGRTRLGRQRPGLGGRQRGHEHLPQHGQHDRDAERAHRGQPGQRPGLDTSRHLDPGAQRPHRRQRDAVDVPGGERDQHAGAALLRQPVLARRGASTCSSTASPSCRTTTRTSTRASTRAR